MRYFLADQWKIFSPETIYIKNTQQIWIQLVVFIDICANSYTDA